MPRIDAPSAGRPMAFHEWSARKGHRHVIPRHDGREAHLREGGSFWITFTSAPIATTMASMYDDRRDDFTTGNLVLSVAGYFDARFTRPELRWAEQSRS